MLLLRAGVETMPLGSLTKEVLSFQSAPAKAYVAGPDFIALKRNTRLDVKLLAQMHLVLDHLIGYTNRLSN